MSDNEAQEAPVTDVVSLSGTEPVYELLSLCGRVLLTGTWFKESGMVHHKEMAAEEVSYVIKSVFMNVIPKTRCKFDPDFHCQGTPIAWKKSLVRLKETSKRLKIGVAKQCKSTGNQKNKVINVGSYANDTPKSSSSTLPEPVNNDARMFRYNAHDFIDLFWGSFQIATGCYSTTDAKIRVM